MMSKIKQKIIVVLLIIAIAVSALITLNFASTTSAYASAGYMDYPQITVLTHGWSSRASNWSNTDGLGGAFAYDEDSLIQKLAVKAGGAYVYRVITSGGYQPSFTLFENYDTTTKFSANNCDGIKNVNMHIIIVFDSLSNGDLNNIVYSEFEHMLNSVIARVKYLNNGKNPKVNLIGHSRGGITNLQYALEYPENVDSMISIGTPYFGSKVAKKFGRVLYPNAGLGLEDITSTTVYDGYYTTWTNGYENKYKNINSIAIGGTTTIEYQIAVLRQLGGQNSGLLADLLGYYSNAGIQGVTVAFARAAYPGLLNTYPALGMFTEDEFVDLIMILNSEIHYGAWYSDVFVPIDSQQGISDDKNYYFTKYVKEFTNDNTSLTPKRAINDLPIIHNLETYDPDIHSYILKNIVMDSGDIIDNEISNVGKVYYTGEGGKSTYKWQIKIRNIHDEARTYAYNTQMCFFDDAKNWTGLYSIKTFRLESGETKIVEIYPTGAATSIAVSSISGNTRYIRYADNLNFKSNVLFDDLVYKMTCYSSTKPYHSYTKNNIKVSNAGKGGNWLIELTNNTGSARTFYYNAKMCFAGDAQNWTGLSDITQTKVLASGETTIIAISENAYATSIAISYISGSTRYILYAYDLNVDGTMSCFESSKPYHSYTKNGMTVSIAGKNGNTWLIELINNTGSTRTFYYNKKMCYAGDAEKWTGLSDISSVELANGAITSVPLQITENMTATSIAISYMDGVYRKIFYAYDLNTSGTMSPFDSSVDTSAPPDECVAAGTLITLADGTQKAVEDLTGDETLLVWNMETGTFDSAPIMFIDSDLIGHYEVISLEFSDGTTVDVIAEHGFWNVDLNEYVYLDANAAQYIGDRFNKQVVKADGTMGWTEVTLTDVEISTEVTTAYSPVTYGHLCYYVNGMLSMPGGITGLFNIFEIDEDTMTIDADDYLEDVEEYGLFTYEEFYEMYPVSEDVFNAFGGKYLKISVGKGLIDYETIGALIERYSEFF